MRHSSSQAHSPESEDGIDNSDVPVSQSRLLGSSPGMPLSRPSDEELLEARLARSVSGFVDGLPGSMPLDPRLYYAPDHRASQSTPTSMQTPQMPMGMSSPIVPDSFAFPSAARPVPTSFLTPNFDMFDLKPDIHNWSTGFEALQASVLLKNSLFEFYQFNF